VNLFKIKFGNSEIVYFYFIYKKIAKFMKNVLLTLLLVILVIPANSQTAKNPFSKYGYDVLMATSSRGEFEEFHDENDIVEIGSLLFNTKTNQIVKILEKGETTMDISPATAAMSIDPLCEKYYWISPYVYVANNPMKFIDPDGRKLKWANRLPLENVAKIAATNIGGQIINQLIDDKRSYYLIPTRFGAPTSEYDDRLSNKIIYYGVDPWFNWEGAKMTTETIMGHEMFHAFDQSRGVFNDSRNVPYKTRQFIEGNGVSFENYLRDVYSISPYRNQYVNSGIPDGSMDFYKFSGSGEKITNFKALEKGYDKKGFNMGFSYTKEIKNKEGSQIQNLYMIITSSKSSEITFQIYDNEDEYKKATSGW